MEDLVGPGEEQEERLESLFSESGDVVPDDLLAVAEWLRAERAYLVEPIPAEIAFHQTALAAETARLTALGATRRTQPDRAVADTLVREHALAAAEGARGASAVAGGPSHAGGRWRQRKTLGPVPSWRRRAVTAGAAVLLFTGGSSGLALAANDAAPGDTLYGLDRVLEKVGIGRGGAVERLEEVRHLFDAGNIEGALIHAETVVGETAGDGEAGSSSAVQELEAAAERVVGQDDDSSADARPAVADLLQYLSENVGHVDGQQVARLARNIGGAADDAGPPEVIPPDDPGEGSGGPPAGSPGGRP